MPEMETWRPYSLLVESDSERIHDRQSQSPESRLGLHPIQNTKSALGRYQRWVLVPLDRGQAVLTSQEFERERGASTTESATPDSSPIGHSGLSTRKFELRDYSSDNPTLKERMAGLKPELDIIPLNNGQQSIEAP